MEQIPLFDLPPPASGLPDGLVYEAEFLSRQEEAALLDVVATLPLAAAKYKAYTARRRVVSYGGRFNYDTHRLQPAAELVPALHPLRERVARRLGVAPALLAHVLVAEYRPGTPLGWHRDVPDFDTVVGISLGGEARLRFRPYPPTPARRSDTVELVVAPRSLYVLRGAARWNWQHCVPPTKVQRWSITFRTLRSVR